MRLSRSFYPRLKLYLVPLRENGLSLSDWLSCFTSSQIYGARIRNYFCPSESKQKSR